MTYQPPTLIILAAGMGSRFGGLKQLAPVGPHGECILDYSLYDAYRQGIRSVIFIIRREIHQAFLDHFKSHLPHDLEILYIFQDLAELPRPFAVPIGRTKPWGTGHALWLCRDLVQGASIVINADDFYGPESFELMSKHLHQEQNCSHAMVGYPLSQTTPPTGSVNRGVCQTDDSHHLTNILEHTNIVPDPSHSYFTSDQSERIPPETLVSMNFWGFQKSATNRLDHLFKEFLQRHGEEEKSEFFLPILVQDILSNSEETIDVLSSSDSWLGMTYPDDKEFVQQGLDQFIASGHYPQKLW